MRSVTYSTGVSLDGYIVGPDGEFAWTAPDEEVFRFVTEPVVAPSVSSGARIRPSQWWYTEKTGKSRCYQTAISRS